MKSDGTIAVKKFRLDVNKYTNRENYALLWLKSGFRSIQIDFEEFEVTKNSVYFITPGRNVNISFDSEPEGWILRFSKEYFRNHIREKLIIKRVEVFAPLDKNPCIILSPKIGERIQAITEMIDELLGSQIPNKETAIASLFRTLLVYCDSKCNISVGADKNTNEVQIVKLFKDLVAKHYSDTHKVHEYAKMMNISSKYLNQVVKNVLNVTAKSVIHEQLIIHARRELKFSNKSVKEIAFNLGFSEPFHFSNYFKKMIGTSPSEYRIL